MNHCVPDWDMDGDTMPFPDLQKEDWFSSQQKKSMGPDDKLVELLWRNGQVVLHSQKNRKPSPASNDPKPVLKPDPPIKTGCQGYSAEGLGLMNRNLIHDDETASWLHYPLDDSLANEFCYDFYYEIPTSDPVSIEKPNKEILGEKPAKFGPERSPQTIFKESNNPHLTENLTPELQALMPPPKGKITDPIPRPPSPNLARNVNFSHFSRMGMATKGNLYPSKELLGEKGTGNLIRVEVGESSMTTNGSSNCGSNQVENHSNFNSISSNGADASTFAGAVAEAAQKVPFQSDIGEAIEPTVTSSSGGSGGSVGRTSKQISTVQNNKRKGRYANESECQSEEAEYESVDANKPAQRSASVRRSRAAKVHNLSERRRRDRINERMKALQELIPHCNKSDKASMLDEAIDYLKSLQLQVQIMWMGGGMVPVMFPGLQHYLSPMGIGPTHLPSVNAPSQLPRIPFIDQAIGSVPGANQLPMCLPPALNPVNFQNQIRNSSFPDSYARYLSLMQMAPQAMNLFAYGSQPMQPNQMPAQPSSSTGPCIGGVLSENIHTGKAD